MRKVKTNLSCAMVSLFSLLPVVLWLLASKSSSPFANVQTTLASLGELFALVGLVLFSLNFILATRLPLVEKLFAGLDNVYQKHSIIGQIAFILLLFHPLLLLPRYASGFKESFSFLFLGNVWSRNWGIIALWMMIILIVLTLYLRPKYNLWKITHKFFGAALFLGALHAYLIPGYIMQNLFLKSYVLLFAVLGILAFLYKSVLGKYLLKRYTYIVDGVNYLNDEIIEIILKPGGERLLFDAGQFVFISFEQAGLFETHPFSMSSGPSEDLLRVSVKKLGDYTETLTKKLQKGIVAKIEGPYGVFSYHKTANRRQVWIAGGIGITPFVSFAKDMVEKGVEDIDVTLFYSVRDSRQAVYLDFFKAESLAGRLAVVPFFSSEKGRINAEYIRLRTKNFDENDFFICAPPKMIKELKNDLMDEGISEGRIHSEEFNL